MSKRDVIVGKDEEITPVKRTEDGLDTKNAVYAVSATGWLKSHPKEKIAAGEIDHPELHHFETEVEKIVKHAEELGIRYGKIGFEQSEAGYKHLQPYFQLHKKLKFSTFNTRMEKFGINIHFHLEESRGSAAQNIAYCSKPTGVWEYRNGIKKFNTQLREPITIGEDKLVAKKGARTDLKAVAEDAMSGLFTLTGLMENHPTTFMRHGKALQNMKHLADRARAKTETKVPTCLFLYSEKEGTGKTSDATETNGRWAKEFGYSKSDVFILSPTKGTKLWWDGYDDERVVVIDDLDPKVLHRNNLLPLLQGTMSSVEVKGAKAIIKADVVIITSQHPPEDVFRREVLVMKDSAANEDETYEAFEWVTDYAMLSRFDRIINYGNRPNYRARLKNQVRCNIEDLPDEDSSGVDHNFPTTLAHGVSEGNDGGQSGEFEGTQSPQSAGGDLLDFARRDLGINPSNLGINRAEDLGTDGPSIKSFRKTEDGRFRSVRPSE